MPSTGTATPVSAPRGTARPRRRWRHRCGRRSGGCGSCRRGAPAAGIAGLQGPTSPARPGPAPSPWRWPARPDASRPGRRGHRDRWGWRRRPGCARRDRWTVAPARWVCRAGARSACGVAWRRTAGGGRATPTAGRAAAAPPTSTTSAAGRDSARRRSVRSVIGSEDVVAEQGAGQGAADRFGIEGGRSATADVANWRHRRPVRSLAPAWRGPLPRGPPTARTNSASANGTRNTPVCSSTARIDGARRRTRRRSGPSGSPGSRRRRRLPSPSVDTSTATPRRVGRRVDRVVGARKRTGPSLDPSRFAGGDRRAGGETGTDGTREDVPYLEPTYGPATIVALPRLHHWRSASSESCSSSPSRLAR